MARPKKLYFNIISDRHFECSRTPDDSLQVLLGCLCPLMMNDSFRSIEWQIDDSHYLAIRHHAYLRGFSFTCWVYGVN